MKTILNPYLFFFVIILSACSGITDKTILHNSSVPNLHLGPDSNMYTSWTREYPDGNSELVFTSSIDPTTRTIASGYDWVVNWADFPSMMRFGRKNVVANYLVETDRATFAYDIKLTISNDGGDTWGEAFSPHIDSTITEHGFVSLVAVGEDSFMAVWLDGRKYSQGLDIMELRGALINSEGEIIYSYLIDDNVCSCCATDAISTSDGVTVVYRDRYEGEIRDMSLSHFDISTKTWSAPYRLHFDKWKIAGCPVNGPAIAVSDDITVAAWFTMGETGREPSVLVSHSVNGIEYQEPVKVNSTYTIGRLDVCFVSEKIAAISWMEENESENENVTYLKARTYNINTGELGAISTVAEMDGARSSGFPKMESLNGRLKFVYTAISDQGKTSIGTVTK